MTDIEIINSRKEAAQALVDTPIFAQVVAFAKEHNFERIDNVHYNGFIMIRKELTGGDRATDLELKVYNPCHPNYRPDRTPIITIWERNPNTHLGLNERPTWSLEHSKCFDTLELAFEHILKTHLLPS
jgi:hypothetical protein